MHTYRWLAVLLVVGCGSGGDRSPDWVVSTFNRHFWHGYCSTTNPTVADGVVYFGGGYAWDRRTAVYALDALTGEILWKSPTRGILTGFSVLVDADRIYLGVADSLVGLDRSSGEARWVYPEIGYERMTAGGIVYTERFGPWVAALDGRDGSELWRSELPEAIDQPFALLGDRLYVISGRRLVALDVSTGKVAEPLPELEVVARLAALDSTLMFVAGRDAPWVTLEWNPATRRLDTLPGTLLSVQDDILVLHEGEETFALDRVTRARVWATPYLSTARLGGGVFREGVMYQPIMTGDVRGFRAVDIMSGEERWRFHAGDLVNSPALDPQTLFLGSDDCRLYAFRLP